MKQITIDYLFYEGPTKIATVKSNGTVILATAFPPSNLLRAIADKLDELRRTDDK